jgi:hypothetical protein
MREKANKGDENMREKVNEKKECEIVKLVRKKFAREEENERAK